MSEVWPYLAAIVPTILVATLFYFLIKGMIEGDRRERLAQSRFEAEQDRVSTAKVGESEPKRPAVDDLGPDARPRDDGPRNSPAES